jgi:hypothetical protein
MHIRSKKTIQRRFYNLSYYCEVVQSDLAFMFEYKDFKYFIVVIDCFSGKVFAEPLKNKTSETVKDSLKRLINEFNAPITKFEFDQGTEFRKFKIFCKENNILFKYKYGANKANFAENIIQVIKRRLYKLLRGTLSKDWPNALKKVVTDFNNTPLKKIGFLKPNEISSKYDSKKVRDALKSQNQQLKDEPNYSELQKNQKNFSSAKGEKLHLGDYVYVNFRSHLITNWKIDFELVARSLEVTAKSDENVLTAKESKFTSRGRQTLRNHLEATPKLLFFSFNRYFSISGSLFPHLKTPFSPPCPGPTSSLQPHTPPSLH